MISKKLERWQLEELLRTQPGLSLKPIVEGVVRISGTFSFSANADGREQIEDTYKLDISVPDVFPSKLPLVTELGGRIPKDFHTFSDGTLCLGSPTRLRLKLCESPTLPTFANECLIPYLYGYSFKEKNGYLPFGELDHGPGAILKDYADLFGVKDEKKALEMIRLASLKKRDANKQRCPCGSGRRLGSCHNLQVNQLRHRLGRSWFRDQYTMLIYLQSI